MKQKVIIIGGGQIVTHYKEGLEASPIFEVVALCDVDEQCPARAVFPDLPFYTDYTTAIEEKKPNGVIIAVPTELHGAIAMACLKIGVDVYLEKPVATTLKSTKFLYIAANTYGRRLVPLFHWRYADEVLFLEKYLAGKEITHASVYIRDDYACNPRGTIRSDRLGLCGAWLDSGINALSYLNQICTFDCMTLTDKVEYFDKSCDRQYFSMRRFKTGPNSEMEIIVNWSTDSRKKESRIIADGEEIFVDHTEQKVWSSKGILFHKPVEDRLSAHYVNMFASKELLEESVVYDGEYLHDVLFLEEGSL